MSTREKWKWVYKVTRSILFTAIAFIAFIYVLLYILLSVPAIQNKVKSVAERELSALFTSRLEIGELSIYPFNEIVVKDAKLFEPDSDTKCIKIQRLGAAISLWRLMTDRKIVITYVELVGLDARLSQSHKGAPLNIQFLIDAFKPKDKNKPPTKFDLEIRNIVIRKCKASLSRPWILEDESGFPDYRFLEIDDINADLVIPKLKNDSLSFDLRRLAFDVKDLTKVSDLRGKISLLNNNLYLKDIDLTLPHSKLRPADLIIPLNNLRGDDFLFSNRINISLNAPYLRLSDFAFLYPPLAPLSSDLGLNIQIGLNKGSIAVPLFEIFTLESGSSKSEVRRTDDFMLQLDNVIATLAKSPSESDSEAARQRIKLNALDIESLILHSSPSFNNQILRSIQLNSSSHSANISKIIDNLLELDLESSAHLDFSRRNGSAIFNLTSGVGNLAFNADWIGAEKAESFNISLNSEGFRIGKLLSSDLVSSVAVDLDAEVRLADKFENLYKYKFTSIEAVSDLIRYASIDLNMPEAVISGYSLRDIDLSFVKNMRDLEFSIDSDDDNFNLALSGDAHIDGSATTLNLDGDIIKLHPGVIAPFQHNLNFDLSAEFGVSLHGNSFDNLAGRLNLQRIHFADLQKKRELNLDIFDLIADINGDGSRKYTILSDWIEGNISGKFYPSHVGKEVAGLFANAFPEFIHKPAGHKSVSDNDDHLEFNFHVSRNGEWAEFFNLPIRLLYEVDLSGNLDMAQRELLCRLSAPYIQQGKDKLIRNINLSALIDDDKASLQFGVIYPTKKGDLELITDIHSVDGNLFAGFDFNPGRTTGFFGHLDLEASIKNSLSPLGKLYSLHILPGCLYLNNASWNVADSYINYYAASPGNIIEVNDFCVSHANQFVKVSGRVSSDSEDEVIANLNEVDLDYIFDTLNINYVHFGGKATGEAYASQLFSRQPVAETRGLFVKDLSYNNGVLGDARLYGNFDMAKKRVGIRADIDENKRQTAIVDGGIWIGRDSLSFDINADKVKIDFLYPFMQAFASKVEGRASGNAKLYGTFSDIDMRGRLFADTITLGVAYTNVEYSGRDSVIINPGKIIIPSFTLNDQYGHSAKLEGSLTHRYFHDPQFDFRISDARELLVYDTNPKMNPVWYGRIFGTGGGRILGVDNYVGITADMTTEANSNFTFVLSDQEEATEYNFLTFTDKHKKHEESYQEVEISEEDEIVNTFKKKVNSAAQGPESVFGMDIRATIQPSTKMTLIMDPVAGDKIIAHGSGAMNMTYRSDTEDLRMFGKYILDEGVYNFSLQDLILKDFIIKSGSSISFNGDPMAGILDIRAAYRVNTNLTDLDQSFALDRDLNRTNVPVDAMLLVSGEMEHPDISFDIELPTLNDEVQQKVRSVISSDEMMNLQMIYLLALNRFYTPEYMGGTSGGEWASVASSTISSQLQNIMGQLTDKFSVLPSFKSDKGDFSDLEVDVALSSRLFNNRLLINGNLGYRDPSISSTTFIGDFDIEYLLNPSGAWRLKAYNHFNDQNYYLRSALTTQGVGVVWRRDFNHIFGINKKKKDKNPITLTIPDTIPSPITSNQTDSSSE